MNFTFTEDQLLIKQTAKEFAEREILSTATERDLKGEFPREIIKKLGDLGFMGMIVSPEYGGAGMDTVSYVLAMEEIAKVDASVAVIMSVINSLVCYALNEYGTEEQKQRYLLPLAQGKIIGAFSLSEPEAGSNATNQHTYAEKDGSEWIINGTKNWITNGTNADIFLVFVQTNSTMRHKGITAFIVEKGTPGLDIGKKEDKMGIRSSDTCSVSFTNCRVPSSNIIWEEGKGFNLAMNALNGGRIGIAAQATGIASGAFDLALKYAKERKAFGKPIIELQLIQQKIADMSTKIEAARLLTLKAAFLKDNHQDYVRAASQAKLFASQIAVECTDEAIQIHGGYGYVREYNVERMYRDAKVTEIYEGTSEIQRIVIARSYLG